MIGKPQFKTVVGFACGFILIYGLLIFPWPGFNDAYDRYFQAMGQIFFAEKSGKRILKFGPGEMKHNFYVIKTQITVGNREQINDQGEQPVKIMGIDTRGVGWIPTALTIALIAASPVPWKRRGVALAWGVVLIHLFILFSIWVCIWNLSADLSLVVLSPLGKGVAEALQETLITQMGASFIVPLAIWLVVTFRREDFSGIVHGR